MTSADTTAAQRTHTVTLDLSDRIASLRWFERACAAIPGGVHSPVRAFKSVTGLPVYFAATHGARVTDVDGNRFIDFCMSWGPLILGHAHPEIIEPVRYAATLGLSRITKSSGLAPSSEIPAEPDLAKTVAFDTLQASPCRRGQLAHMRQLLERVEWRWRGDRPFE